MPRAILELCAKQSKKATATDSLPFSSCRKNISTNALAKYRRSTEDGKRGSEYFHSRKK
jgi:hypothetical protein